MKFKETVKIQLKDIVESNCIVWDDYYTEITNEILTNYGKNKNYIFVDKNNKIIDGNHRYCILYKEYGENHEIFVKRILITRRLYYIIIFLLSPILTPIGFVIGSINKIKNDIRFKKNS